MFLYTYALEYNYFFHVCLKNHMDHFAHVKYCSHMESNIIKISKKIEENNGDHMRI